MTLADSPTDAVDKAIEAALARTPSKAAPA
jgi:hypothetical protein